MKNFITILNHRIQGRIERYTPRDDLYLLVYFKASRSIHADCEAFKFETEKERDEMLLLLDSLL